MPFELLPSAYSTTYLLLYIIFQFIYLIAQDFKCFSIGATNYLAFSTLQYMKIFQYDRGFYEELQSLPFQGVSSIQPLSPPTYRDDTFLLIHGYDPVFKDNFVDLLLLEASSLTFRPLNSTCSDGVESMNLPHRLKPYGKSN